MEDTLERPAIVLGLTFPVMWRTRIGLAILLVLAGAACGTDSDDNVEAAPAGGTSRALTVQVVADKVGIGCTYPMPVAGNGDTIVVSDTEGAVLGTGALQATDPRVSCDWRASIGSVPEADFYIISNGAGERLATIAASEVVGDEVTLTINMHGGVKVGDHRLP
jgi:hypothetical protein